jgi:tripartite-type tricarboxylate transporter receptor subunit TctC
MKLLFGKKAHWICGSGLAAASLFGAALSCGAVYANEFYKGKTVRIVVGYSPGGGYDAYARMIAPYLEKQLGATVLVENKPGGGGLNALASLLKEPGDGMRMLLMNGESTMLVQLVGKAGNRFDLQKLGYLGRVSYEKRTVVVQKGKAYVTLDGMRTSSKPVFFGAGDRVDSMGDAASIFCHALKIKCKLVTGYKGAADAALAIERGEVDGLVTSESQTANLMRKRDLTAVAVLSQTKSDLLPDVPTIFELSKLSPADSKWLRFRADIADFGRTLVVPGDTPKDRIAELEKAVAAALADPKLIADGERTKRPIAYASPAELRRIVKDILGSTDAKEKDAIKTLLLTAY